MIYPLTTRRLRSLRDTTEKAFFVCKSIQNKVRLLTSQCYISYVKLVFQWCPTGGRGCHKIKTLTFKYSNRNFIFYIVISDSVMWKIYFRVKSQLSVESTNFSPLSLYSWFYLNNHCQKHRNPILSLCGLGASVGCTRMSLLENSLFIWKI